MSRFNLGVVRIQFYIAFFLPIVLFIVSCTILVVIQKKVVVGDDAKMRIKGADDTVTLFEKCNNEPTDKTV